MFSKNNNNNSSNTLSIDDVNVHIQYGRPSDKYIKDKKVLDLFNKFDFDKLNKSSSSSTSVVLLEEPKAENNNTSSNEPFLLHIICYNGDEKYAYSDEIDLQVISPFIKPIEVFDIHGNFIGFYEADDDSDDEEEFTIKSSNFKILFNEAFNDDEEESNTYDLGKYIENTNTSVMPLRTNKTVSWSPVKQVQEYKDEHGLVGKPILLKV